MSVGNLARRIAKRLLFSVHPWVIVGLETFVTLFYYHLYETWRPAWQLFVLEYRQGFVGFLYFVPLVYATFVFGSKGCIATWILSSILIFPKILHYSVSPFLLFRNLSLFSVGFIVIGSVALEIEWRAKHRRLNLQREEEQRRYVEGVLGAQEEERTRISQELHDEAIQSLLAIAHVASRARKNRYGAGAQDSGDVLTWICDEAIRLSGDVRRLCYDLRPTMLDSLGLVAAVRWLADQHEQDPQIETEIALHGEVRRLPERIETVCFRVIQEALSNVRRHSKAEKAIIALSYFTTAIEVVVTDNGEGFSLPRGEAAASGGNKLGISGMLRRVESVGGELTVDSSPRWGTTVAFRIPLTVATGVRRDA